MPVYSLELDARNYDTKEHDLLSSYSQDMELFSPRSTVRMEHNCIY
jgi:hypothetical protein